METPHNPVPPVLDEGRFVVKEDGVVVDTGRKLAWLLKDTWQLSGKWMSWHHVREYIAELNQRGFCGFNDWRLPTANEVKSLFDPKHVNKDYQGVPAHLHPVFPPGFGFVCWTSDVRNKVQAMRFGYRKGAGMYDDIYRSSRGATRPVRDIPKEGVL
jgi:hypothetical protein